MIYKKETNVDKGAEEATRTQAKSILKIGTRPRSITAINRQKRSGKMTLDY